MGSADLVLVVDDNPPMLRSIARLLRQFGYATALFPSAEAFANHGDFGNALCVLLDINLSDGSGIDLRHRLTVDGHSVPVIYMTGNPAVRTTALASGHRVSNQAIFSSGTDRVSQGSIGGAFIASLVDALFKVCTFTPSAHSCPGRVRRHVRSWRKPTPHSEASVGSTD